MRVCLDVSHSKLACNYLSTPFNQFLEAVLPFTAHLHLADAQGVDGEGLQINAGEINWPELFYMINKYAPNASFIPEIWQGHKNNGEELGMHLISLKKAFKESLNLKNKNLVEFTTKQIFTGIHLY